MILGEHKLGAWSRAMMRFVSGATRKLLVAVLLALCIGLQLLEASGRWDRAIKDTTDEAVIVTVVLCIGMALLVAPALLARIRPARTISHVVVALLESLAHTPTALVPLISCDSPPVSLRI